MMCQKMASSQYDSATLDGRNRFLSAASGADGSRSHLYHHQRFSVPHDQVELTPAATVVAPQPLQPLA